MPCQRLAVKDAAGAAQRAKLLDGEGHGHTLSRAARPRERGHEQGASGDARGREQCSWVGHPAYFNQSAGPLPGIGCLDRIREGSAAH